MTYLDWMRPRLRELYRVLKLTGSFYYHCDWHATHYIKVELDRLFGFDNFQNEIIWRRTTSHGDAKQGARHYGRIHDTLLFYTKSAEYTWNTQFVEFSESQIQQQYNKLDKDGRRYRLVTPTAKKPGGDTSYEWKGVHPPKGRYWAYNREKMAEMDAQGLLYYSKTGQPYIKYYLDERPGVAAQSLWTDVSPISPTAKERLGYPTQKPLALLERIVSASSDEGQVVLDAFCGCGTTLEAAAKLKRKWIGIDFSPTACRVMAERLEKRLGLKESVDFTLRDMPKTVDQLHRMPPFEFQNWAVVALGGIPNRVKVGDYGIDGRLYLADMAKEEKAIMHISEKAAQGIFETLDKWYPIQVKQVDKVGRPDIDKFETAMRRDKRLKGYFVAFGFSGDATREIQRAQTAEGLEITPITVEELLGYERTASN
jgi:DNA modification methylase